MKTLYIIGAVVATVAVGAAGYGAYRMIRAKTIAEQNRRMDGVTPDRPSVDMTSGPVIVRGAVLPAGFRRATPRVTVEQVVQEQPREQPQSQTSADTSDPEPSRNPNVRVNLFTLR